MEFRNDPLYKLATGKSIVNNKLEEDSIGKQVDNIFNKRMDPKNKDYTKFRKKMNGKSPEEIKKAIEFDLRKQMAVANGASEEEASEIAKKETERQIRKRGMASELNNAQAANKDAKQRQKDQVKKLDQQKQDQEEQEREILSQTSEGEDTNTEEQLNQFRDEANKANEKAEQEIADTQAEIDRNNDTIERKKNALNSDLNASENQKAEKTEPAETSNEPNPDDELEVEVENNKPTDTPSNDAATQPEAKKGSVQSVLQKITNLQDYNGFQNIVRELINEMKSSIADYSIKNQPTQPEQPAQETQEAPAQETPEQKE